MSCIQRQALRRQRIPKFKRRTSAENGADTAPPKLSHPPSKPAADESERQHPLSPSEFNACVHGRALSAQGAPQPRERIANDRDTVRGSMRPHLVWTKKCGFRLP